MTRDELIEKLQSLPNLPVHIEIRPDHYWPVKRAFIFQVSLPLSLKDKRNDAIALSPIDPTE